MNVKISVVIITYNEEKHIERCIKSVLDVADEILVIDSFSEDKTKDICKQFNVRFEQRPFIDYIEQKNYAVEAAMYNHVLSLDADECLTETLKNSIQAVKANWQSDGYVCNRLNNFCGKWIRYGDWYPDKKLRLWDRKKGKWHGSLIHEKVEMSKNASIGFLKGDLLHYSYIDRNQYNIKAENFSATLAKAYFNEGLKPGIFKLYLSPVFKFIRSYFLHLGFLDGYHGFLISYLSANTTFKKYYKLKKLYCK